MATRLRPGWAVFALFGTGLLACGAQTSAKPSMDNDGGGSPTLAGGAESSPATSGAAGNSSTSVAGSASPAQGGSTSAAGAAGPTAGQPSGDVAGAPGASGAETGGSGGASSETAGAAGMGGAGPSPMPSPGCALASKTVPSIGQDPSNDSLTYARELRPHLPPGYDGVTPVPLLLVFHATGGSFEASQLLKDQPNAAHYLIGEAVSGSVNTFESIRLESVTWLFNKLLENACVDLNRLFAVGNGSGGRFMMGWLTTKPGTSPVPAFRAIAVVGTYYREPTPAPLPLLFLHPVLSRNSRGVAQDEDGMKAFALLMKANQCSSDSSTPFAAMGCTTGTVDPGCVDLDMCAAPLRFCHHTSPDSDGDPWPCFATSAVYQFFDSYRGY